MNIRFSALGGVLLGLAGCAPESLMLPTAPAPTARAPIPVVLDTDIGSDVDDTWALLHLLRSPELDLQMVLVGTANTTYRGRLAAKFLEVAGRSDIPVGLGPTGGSSHEYQLPWVGDYTLRDYPGPVYEDGVDAFIELVHASPEPITLIAIGPLPNIAEALRRDPTIAPKVHFVGMHGSIDEGYGAGSDPVPETNVRVDVEAFRAVHAADWASFRITPLDTCGHVVLEGEPYQELRRSRDPAVQALLENYRVWAELVTWTEVDYFEEKSSTLFDCVAVYMAYDGSLLEYETIPLSVTDEGMTVRDPEKGLPTRAAMRWRDLEAFDAHLSRRLRGVATE
ncbi:MAG: nucleoside hydrolase [Verrucomicrobiota bacterium]